MRDETEKENSNSIFLLSEEYHGYIANQIITYLKNHLYEEIRIDDICTELNYNKSYLFRQFKQATGCSIMAYFIGLKIDRANKLLRESKLTVTEISNQFAFDSPNYFSKTFKKITGFTPLQYKKLHNHSR